MLANNENYADSFRSLSPQRLDMAVLELCRERREQPKSENEGSKREDGRR